MTEDPDMDSPIKAGRDVIVEVAKAEQEQQKTAQKAIDLVRDAGGYLGSVFRTAANEFGQLLGDQMKYWRFRNFVRIQKRVEEIVSDRGLSPEQFKQIPFGDSFRTLEAASLEEEESVQELWARLIANSIDPTQKVTIRKLYTDILRSLSPAETALLELLWHCQANAAFKSREEVAAFNEEMNELAERKWRRFQSDERNAAVQNLIRLRCVTFRPQTLDLRNLFAVTPIEKHRIAKWAVVDPTEFQKLINNIAELIFVAAGIKDYGRSGSISLSSSGSSFPIMHFGTIEVPEMNFMLTSMGLDLMRACQLDPPRKPSAD
jgi:hypothetical protein